MSRANTSNALHIRTMPCRVSSRAVASDSSLDARRCSLSSSCSRSMAPPSSAKNSFSLASAFARATPSRSASFSCANARMRSANRIRCQCSPCTSVYAKSNGMLKVRIMPFRLSRKDSDVILCGSVSRPVIISSDAAVCEKSSGTRNTSRTSFARSLISPMTANVGVDRRPRHWTAAGADALGRPCRTTC